MFARNVTVPGAVIYSEQYIPAGTNVGINNWLMRRNFSLYGEDAEIFIPERWLDDQSSKLLREYEFVFGHGARV